MTEGVKYDAGKPRLGLHLVEVPHAFEAVGTLLGKGAEKYSVGNWKAVPDAEQRYLDAMLRHLTAHYKGEVIDPETEQKHLAAVAVNALFLLELSLLNDNSGSTGQAPDSTI